MLRRPAIRQLGDDAEFLPVIARLEELDGIGDAGCHRRDNAHLDRRKADGPDGLGSAEIILDPRVLAHWGDGEPCPGLGTRVVDGLRIRRDRARCHDWM